MINVEIANYHQFTLRSCYPVVHYPSCASVTVNPDTPITREEYEDAG